MSTQLPSNGTERLAKAALLSGNHGAAIHNFFLLLQQQQQGTGAIDVASRLEDDIIFCLNSFGDAMAQSNQENATTNMTWMWMKALELTGYKCKKLMCSAGIFFLGHENYQDALKFIQLSLAIDSTYLPALQNLEVVRSNAIDRWHFRMLNDKVRNDSYFSAIKVALQRKPNAVVYDIGAGSGILSIYAAMHGASKVYCCEVSRVLADMARSVVKEHKLDHLISVINQISYDVQLPEKVDIIVTELVDSGLLGEHIIPVLSDSVKRFLKDDGIVIPYSADVYGYPFESDEIDRRQKVSSELWESTIETLAASKLGSNWNRRYAAISPNFVIDDSYTCEDAASLPHKALSEPLYLGNIIFDAPVDCLSSRSISVQCKAVTDGFWHGFLYWFTLNLLPPGLCEPSIIVSTAPGRRNCGWDQAIIFASCMDYFYFNANDDIELSWGHDNDRLHVIPLSSNKKPSRDMTLYQISEMDIASINNSSRSTFYWGGLLDAVAIARSTNLESIPSPRPVQIIELGALWESVCVEANEMLACITTVQQHVVCYDSSVSEYLVSRCGDLDADKIAIYDEISSKEYILLSRSDIFVLDIVGGNGCLCHENLKELALLVSLREEVDKSDGSDGTHQNMICVPSNFSMVVSLIECSAVLDQFRLDPSNISMDTTISAHMNVYGSRYVSEIDLKSIKDVRYLSTPQVVHRFNILDICRSIGSRSAGTSTIECSQSGSSHGIAIWYLLENSSSTDSILLTGPNDPRATNLKLQPNSHYRQLIILFDTPVILAAGDHVEIVWELDINYGIHIKIVPLT